MYVGRFSFDNNFFLENRFLEKNWPIQTIESAHALVFFNIYSSIVGLFYNVIFKNYRRLNLENNRTTKIFLNKLYFIKYPV